MISYFTWLIAEVAEWQTHMTQNHAGNRVGSTPTFGTIFNLDVAILLRFFVFFEAMKNEYVKILIMLTRINSHIIKGQLTLPFYSLYFYTLCTPMLL